METRAAATAAAADESAPETAEPDDDRRDSVVEELRDAIRRKLEPSGALDAA